VNSSHVRGLASQPNQPQPSDQADTILSTINA